jgi:hypothetical protein
MYIPLFDKAITPTAIKIVLEFSTIVRENLAVLEVSLTSPWMSEIKETLDDDTPTGK